MEVNKLESREVLLMLFGLPLMVTLIVLLSIGVGHWVTARSDRPTNVTVTPAMPKIDVNVPQAAAPEVHVSAPVPKFDINVPHGPAPAVTVTAPPAMVTILDRRESAASESRLHPAGGKNPALPTPSTLPANFEPAKPVHPASEAPKAIPVKSEVPKASLGAQVSPNFQDGQLTLDMLYEYAEKYIESYCSKNQLSTSDEARKWNDRWQKGLQQALADNIDSDEQSYLNRVVMGKRECFDIEKATPEKIVEGCRLMLRYRDGKLAWMKAMRDVATTENLKKTLVFLAAGVR